MIFLLTSIQAKFTLCLTVSQPRERIIMDMHLPDSKARKKLGDLGERLASEKLAAEGYKIIEANWRCRYGEFDLVAWQGKCLVFVEVRTRRGDQSGSPEESLTPRKLRTLHLLGDLYLQAHPELFD